MEQIFLIRDGNNLPPRYVQLKLTPYEQNGEQASMVQIIDVSTRILYDQTRADNKFLSLMNACVSHELRNPLNSIVAQNIEKAKLYKDMESIIEEDPQDLKRQLTQSITTLKDGQSVQESASTLIRFHI